MVTRASIAAVILLSLTACGGPKGPQGYECFLGMSQISNDGDPFTLTPEAPTQAFGFHVVANDEALPDDGWCAEMSVIFGLTQGDRGLDPDATLVEGRLYSGSTLIHSWSSTPDSHADGDVTSPFVFLDAEALLTACDPQGCAIDVWGEVTLVEGDAVDVDWHGGANINPSKTRQPESAALDVSVELLEGADVGR